MADFAAYLACLIGVAGGCYKLAWSRANPGVTYVSAIGVCFGTAMAVLAPTSVALIGRVSPVPNLPSLAGDELKMAAACFIALTGWWVRAPDRIDVRRRYARLAWVVLAVEAVLFGVADSSQVEGSIALPGGARWIFVAYDVIFLGYLAAGLLVFIVLMGRHIRELPAGPVRAGLRLAVLAALVALVWAGWVAEDIYSMITRGVQDSDEDTQSAVFAVVCIALAAAGGSVAIWRPHLARLFRRLWAIRAHRRLRPLWMDLRAARPEIAMTTRPRLIRDPEFALYRRIIEIRDAQLALGLPTPTELQPTLEAEAAHLARSRHQAGADQRVPVDELD